jgi:Uma2 family endonuclease
MGMPAQVGRHWTAAHVRELIAAAPLASPRYELVDGELLVTPSPSAPHQALVVELQAALREYVGKHNIGVAATSPSDVELEPERITQPDVYVVSFSEWERVLAVGFPLHTLFLAVEVLSPSSSRYDRVSKRALYQRYVPEYWVIDTDARVVERWRTGDDRPEIVTQSLVWQGPGSVPPLNIDLPRLFSTALRDPPPRDAGGTVRERPGNAYGSEVFDVRAWLAQLPRSGWSRAMLHHLPEQMRFEIIDGELLLPDYVFDARIPTPRD